MENSGEFSQMGHVEKNKNGEVPDPSKRELLNKAWQALKVAGLAGGVAAVTTEAAKAQWKSGEVYPRDRRDEQYERAGVSRPTADGSVNNPLNNPYGEPAPTVTPSATPTIQPQETDIEPVQKKAQRRGFGLRGLFGRE